LWQIVEDMVIGGTRNLCNNAASLAVLLLSTKVLLVALPIGRSIPWGRIVLGGFMSIGTEILSLRQDKFSSVAALIGALDRLSASNEHLEMRVYAVSECADLVLLNVAVHAMDALLESPIQTSRRAVQSSRRRRSRHIPGHHQGQITMFATT
jgi:hypothetical protein